MGYCDEDEWYYENYTHEGYDDMEFFDNNYKSRGGQNGKANPTPHRAEHGYSSLTKKVVYMSLAAWGVLKIMGDNSHLIRFHFA